MKPKQNYYQRAAEKLKKRKTSKNLRIELFDRYLIEDVLSRFQAPPGFWREIVAQKTNYVVQRPCGYINTGHREYINDRHGNKIEVTDIGS